MPLCLAENQLGLKPPQLLYYVLVLFFVPAGLTAVSLRLFWPLWPARFTFDNWWHGWITLSGWNNGEKRGDRKKKKREELISFDVVSSFRLFFKQGVIKNSNDFRLWQQFGHFCVSFFLQLCSRFPSCWCPEEIGRRLMAVFLVREAGGKMPEMILLDWKWLFTWRRERKTSNLLIAVRHYPARQISFKIPRRVNFTFLHAWEIRS